jgi:CheY-like chemotaxis protein
MPRIVKNILLVEPEGVLAEITAFRLELLGYKVEVVESAEDALKSVSTTMPDLIITDLVLNGTTALGLLETLTSREDTKDIPIMVLSLDADLDRVTSVHKCGATEFLVVPFQPEVLQEKVAKLLAGPRARRDEKLKTIA